MNKAHYNRLLEMRRNAEQQLKLAKLNVEFLQNHLDSIYDQIQDMMMMMMMDLDRESERIAHKCENPDCNIMAPADVRFCSQICACAV